MRCKDLKFSESTFCLSVVEMLVIRATRAKVTCLFSFIRGVLTSGIGYSAVAHDYRAYRVRYRAP
jgi:hypothetical protein